MFENLLPRLRELGIEVEVTVRQTDPPGTTWAVRWRLLAGGDREPWGFAFCNTYAQAVSSLLELVECYQD